jgi:GGDEF domain-containing protein
MSLRGSDNSTGDKGGRGRLSIGNSRSNARVLSIERGKVVHKEALESLLSSALRSDDNELDQILSALEEISNWLKSGAPKSRRLENVLQQAASCAVRQSLLDREIRSLAVTDELTGLYNRRGFLASATHQLKLAHRQSQDVILLFFDMDNLKGINDAFGHREGDLAIIRAADALEEPSVTRTFWPGSVVTSMRCWPRQPLTHTGKRSCLGWIGVLKRRMPRSPVISCHLPSALRGSIRKLPAHLENSWPARIKICTRIKSTVRDSHRHDTRS